MSKFVIVRFAQKRLLSEPDVNTDRACEELQSQLVWSLSKDATISICEDTTGHIIVVSSAQAKG